VTISFASAVTGNSYFPYDWIQEAKLLHYSMVSKHSVTVIG